MRAFTILAAALVTVGVADADLVPDPGSIKGVKEFHHVRVAASPGGTVMAWLSAAPFMNGQVKASYSTDGQHWGAPVLVSEGYPGWAFAGGAGEFSLARAASGKCWIAWSVATAWGAVVPPERGSADAGQHYFARGSTVWLASSADGRTWSTPQPVALAPAFNRAPGIIEMPDGRIGVIWVCDRGRPELCLTFTTDGQTWSPPTDIGFVQSVEAASLSSTSYQYELARCGPLFVPDSRGRLTLAWVRGDDGAPQLWTTVSTDGQQWSSAVRASVGPGDKGSIAIEEVGGGYSLYWSTQVGDKKQRWVAHSPDFASWSKPALAPVGK